MSDSTLTLVLNGEVPLSVFAKALDNFSSLVAALSDEIAHAKIDWIVQDLQASSAHATALGRGEPKGIETVISAYADVGAALEADVPLPYNRKISAAAYNIISIEDKRISNVLFQTATRDAIIRPRPASELAKIIEMPRRQEAAPLSLRLAPAYGVLQGRIQTLMSRGGLRFTLYDKLYDKAVSCYLRDDQQQSVNDLWGQLALVEGLITRDPLSGRPIAIRDISAIHPLPEPGNKFDYQYARGAVPSLTGISAEEAVRKIRNAN